jgi:hypothetical protein
MLDLPAGRKAARLTVTERLIAGLVGAGLLGVALVLVIAPPQRRIALSQCPDAAAGCIVSVDSDLSTLAAVLATGAAAAIILGLLGIRFNQVKVAGTEFRYEMETAGLALAAPALGALPGPDDAAPSARDPEEVPVRIDVRKGLGEPLHAVSVAVTELIRPMRDIAPSFLDDYMSARRVSQHSHFLTHILGPATRRGQKYSVAIRVTPHEDASHAVTSATFYLGPAWGNKAFAANRGPDGRFGIVTEAFGPFLALCEVGFDDGSRILLDHYCDFDMGSLLSLPS